MLDLIIISVGFIVCVLWLRCFKEPTYVVGKNHISFRK
jgi:hypothetical protein